MPIKLKDKGVYLLRCGAVICVEDRGIVFHDDTGMSRYRGKVLRGGLAPSVENRPECEYMQGSHHIWDEDGNYSGPWRKTPEWGGHVLKEIEP